MGGPPIFIIMLYPSGSLAQGRKHKQAAWGIQAASRDVIPRREPFRLHGSRRRRASRQGAVILLGACVLLVAAVLSGALFLRERRGFLFMPVAPVSSFGDQRHEASDVWILLFSNRDPLLDAYRMAARVEAETGNADYEVYFARDAAEFQNCVQRANRRDRVYSLFIVSHAGAGMIAYTSNGVDETLDPGDLPGGLAASGGIGPWTDVWFYGCRFAKDDGATSTPDWTLTGRISSRYFNGARVWGNTGLVNLNSLNGTGLWMHFQLAQTAPGLVGQ